MPFRRSEIRPRRVAMSLAIAGATGIVSFAGLTNFGIAGPIGLLGLPIEWFAVAIVAGAVAVVVLARALLPRLGRPERTAVTVGVALALAAYVLLAVTDPIRGGDAFVFYSHRLPNPYDTSYADYGFAYSPVFAQLIAPFQVLPWPLFIAAWTALLSVVLLRLAGPLAIAVVLVPFVALDMQFANVNLVIAGAIALGFRWPALWSVVLLTKVTPGIGLVWFAVRGEWRRLGIAIGTTAALSAASFALAPDLWRGWLGVLAANNTVSNAIDLGPLPVRLAIAALIVAWGARTDRPWTVPVAATVGLPVLWPGGLTLLVAAVPLARRSGPPHRRSVDSAIAPAGVGPAGVAPAGVAPS